MDNETIIREKYYMAVLEHDEELDLYFYQASECHRVRRMETRYLVFEYPVLTGSNARYFNHIGGEFDSKDECESYCIDLLDKTIYDTSRELERINSFRDRLFKLKLKLTDGE